MKEGLLNPGDAVCLQGGNYGFLFPYSPLGPTLYSLEATRTLFTVTSTV